MLYLGFDKNFEPKKVCLTAPLKDNDHIMEIDFNALVGGWSLKIPQPAEFKEEENGFKIISQFAKSIKMGWPIKFSFFSLSFLLCSCGAVTERRWENILMCAQSGDQGKLFTHSTHFWIF